MAASPSSPPERHFITKLADTSLYVSTTDEPWRLPAQAFVLPLGPRVGMNGQLATAYRGTLGGPDREKQFREMLRSMVESQTKPDPLRPDRPVRVSLPDWVEWPRPPETDPASKSGPPDRCVIAATAYSTEEATVDGAAQAAGAVVRLAATARLGSVTLPTLGTGQGNLPSDRVIRAMLAAIQSALLTSTGRDGRVREITLVTRDGAAATAAFDFFNRRAQRPLNDLPEGHDLLNVAVEARALAETLLLRDLEPPVSVGIIGGWGSGKSFIMHLMQERMTGLRTQMLSKEQTWPADGDEATRAKLFPYVGHIYQIKFDAWTYAKGDLWSSLMQTIFFELNRQITLERQLREAKLDEKKTGEEFLRDGGEFWQALSEMNTEAREALLESDSSIGAAYKKWKDDPNKQPVDDVLWTELKKLQEAQHEKALAALKAKEQEVETKQTDLNGKQRELAQTDAELKRLGEQDLLLMAQERALQALPDELLNKIGASAAAHVRALLKAATQANGAVADIDWKAFQPDSVQTLLNEMLKQPRALGIFISIFLLGTALFVVSNLVKEIWPAFVIQAAGLLAYLTTALGYAAPLLRRLATVLSEWNKSVTQVYDTYKNRLAGEFEAVVIEHAENTRNKIEDKQKLEKDIAEAESRLAKLQVEVEQQRRLLSPLASYDSLLQFIASRLSDTYEKKLGFVHTVQRDLRELTNSLVADSGRPERIPKRLLDLFPRGPARVVLFIDDLDRCPPDQVVQVLEAAQLLLKTELFVVVMAIDVRYVARALEKAYDKILVRRGKPSGLDYIEKIIQIPYRVRPIETEALKGYLEAQMQVEQAAESQPGVVTQTSTGRPTAVTTAASAAGAPRAFDVPPSQVLEFSGDDLNDLLTCCRLVDLSPRAIKRLINVSKIVKVVWFRSGFKAERDVTQGVFGLLALSDRFPDLVRDLFEDLASHLRLGDANSRKPFRDLIASFRPIDLTDYQEREWNRLLNLVKDTDLLPSELSPQGMGLTSFNLIRSFCFVGDIGYDPREDEKDHEAPQERTSTTSTTTPKPGGTSTKAPRPKAPR